MEKPQKPKINVEVTVTKRSVKKWVLIGLIAIITIMGYKYFDVRKQVSAKREAFETQRQVMIEYWEEQGLSDEEIQLKLEDLRQERIDSGERSSGIGIMRILGGGGGHSMRR